MAWLSEKFVVS